MCLPLFILTVRRFFLLIIRQSSFEAELWIQKFRVYRMSWNQKAQHLNYRGVLCLKFWSIRDTLFPQILFAPQINIQESCSGMIFSQGNQYLSIIYFSIDSLYCNIPINPMLFSLISQSSSIQNDVNASSFKPSKSSDGDVLFIVNQVLFGTFELLLLGCTLKTYESPDHL